MKSHQCLVIIILLLTGLSYGRASEDKFDFVSDPSDMVEVYHNEEIYAPYLERRASSGTLIGLAYQSYKPSNYISTLGSNEQYGQVYTKAISVLEFEIDYKYNTDMGAILFGLSYGSGGVNSLQTDSTYRSISISKPALNIGFMADAIWDEPTYVPFAKLQVWQMGISEAYAAQSFSGNTQTGFTYTAGVLFQLNRLDKEAAVNSLNNYGIENSYFELSANKYTTTQSSSDANTESDFDISAAFRVEF